MSHLRMLKATVVTRSDDVEDVLEALQDAAVLHVAPVAVDPALADELTPDVVLDSADAEVLATAAHLERLSHALGNVAPASARRQDTTTPYAEVLARVDALLAERTASADALVAVQAQAAALAPWEDFDPADVDALEARGVRMIFVRVTPDEWAKLSERFPAHAMIRTDDRWTFGVLLRAVDELDGREPAGLALPRLRLGELEAQIEALEARVAEVNRELGRLAHFQATIKSQLDGMTDRVELVRARMKGLHHASLFAMQGYVPERDVVKLQEALAPFDVALHVEEPSADDRQVPVKLRNNALVRGFESVVTAFSGVSYREKDFTWAVGILFIVFGSLCLLDGGYGLLLLVTGLVLRARGVVGFGNVFAITGVFSTLVGALAGQFFGLVVGVHVLEGYAPPLTLAQKPYDAFMFSLVVGMVAIFFSHLVAIWQRGFKTQATGSLLLVIASMCAVFANLAGEYVLTVLGGWTPPSASTLAVARSTGNTLAAGFGVASLVALVTFPDQVFGPKARIGNVLWTLYSGPTGFLQDLLSHMRLFGISLSGSIMALVVNDIGGRFPLPITVVFAVVAHVFVYVLSLLSLYIHTNRLIFLEFGSKCIDGGHHHFSPLRRRTAS